MCLINIRDDTIWYYLLVLVPIIAILLFTILVVTTLSVDEQNGKINDIEIGNGSAEPRRKRPSQSHQQVAKVIWMPRATPPAGRKKLRSAGSLKEFETFGILAIPEIVLFPIRISEYIVSGKVHSEDNRSPQ